VRENARTVPIEDEQSIPEPAVERPDPHRSEYVALAQRALDESLAALSDGDRLRLRLYYGQGVKLAQIGRMLGEHEATVSRKLERVRKDLRRDIEQRLRAYGISEQAVPECLAQAAGAAELDVSRAMGSALPPATAVEDG
jgi:DNA-directed RNA polymerase specialized sigma24 family protein